MLRVDDAKQTAKSKRTFSPSSRKREPGGREASTARMSPTEGTACRQITFSLRQWERGKKMQGEDVRKNHHRQPRVEVVCVGAAAAALAMRARGADALRLKRGRIRQDDTQRIPVLGCKSDGAV